MRGSRLTTKEFIERASIVHNNHYDYSNVDYKVILEKVIIICPVHGEFEQTPNSHLVGRGCSSCSTANRTKTLDKFIEEVTEIHGDKYKYDNVVYKNTYKKVIITCPIHGDFKQSPEGHLQGRGCSYCEQQKNTDQFIKKAKEVHGDTYNYSKSVYIDCEKDITITCKIHGDFTKKAYFHNIKKEGCPTCSRYNMRLTTEQFIERAKNTHGDRYNYDKTIYIKTNKKLTITCKVHGDFEQVAANHFNGNGCPLCNLGATYSRSDYIKKANGRLCIFYTIRCFNENEEFYKIGITFKSVKQRYSCTQYMPYSYEIISEIIGETGVIWDLEKSEKLRLGAFNYQPKIYFCGSRTECFTQVKIK